MDGKNKQVLVKPYNSALVKRDEQFEALVTIPLANIYETGNAFVVRLDMPGAEKASMNLTIESGRLRIHGTVPQLYDGQASVIVSEIGPRKKYVRDFQLGEGIEYDRVEAGFEEGVLTVTLPKAKSLLPKQITIR
ncbi:MAG: Hsp20/alpha crystallin family protein [Bacteroidota bacterium]